MCVLTGNLFKLLDGYSAETSGGLLICVPSEQLQRMTERAKALGVPLYEVGRVLEPNPDLSKAYIVENPNVIEV